MALLTIAKAAKLVGKSRKTLYNDILTGKLSITQSETGTKQVDTSELIRVYGEIGVKGNCVVTTGITQLETPNYTQITQELTTRNILLEAEIKALHEKLVDKDLLLASKDQNLEDMRNTLRLLEHKTTKKTLVEMVEHRT